MIPTRLHHCVNIKMHLCSCFCKRIHFFTLFVATKKVISIDFDALRAFGNDVFQDEFRR